MGLLHTSNHLALIAACYPPKSHLTPLSDLKPDSNSLSKLCFYAAGRPKKLPKVIAAIYERAERDAKSSGGSSPKARADLAVSVDVVRGLVVECRAELQCFAEIALKVAELGLGTGRQDGLGKRDVELEARGAGLFHAISVLLSGSSIGLDAGLVQQYLRCLSLLSAMAQLSSENTTSKWIALSALHGAAVSELLYSTSSDYTTQIDHIVPALLQNLLNLPIADLQQHFTASDAEVNLSTPGALSSRKPLPIPAPTTPPTPSTLASRAVLILRTIVRLSHAVQLSAKLASTRHWLDRFHGGKLWKESELVSWIGTTGVAASAVQYRPSVVGWWADQVAQIEGEGKEGDLEKHSTLILTLSSILRGPTTLIGLAIGTVLGQLTSLLIRRTRASEDDTLSSDILSAISALAAHVYYSEQLNDIVSDLIDAIRVVKLGGGEAETLDPAQRTRAVRSLVKALGGVLEETEQSNVSPRKKKSSSASSSQNALPLVGNGANGTNGNGTVRPPLPVGEGTVRGNGVLIGAGQGVRSRKETNGESNGPPVLRLPGQGAKRTRISSDIFRGSLFLLTDSDETIRLDYAKVLFTFVSEELDVSIVDGDSKSFGDPSQTPSRFLGELHASIYELASSSSPPAPLSLPNGTSASASSSAAPTRANSLTSRQIPSPTNPKRSRQSSIVSRRRSLPPPPVATVEDFAVLSRIIETIQSKASAWALLAAVPMFFALEKEASRPAPEGARIESVESCKELVRSSLAAVESAWKITLPPLPPASSDEWAPQVVEALASSHTLQAASGSDRATLAASLSTPWSPETARARANPSNIYRSMSSRSVSNLSTLRVTRTPDRARATPTPSVADLQISLGRPASVRGSATPSIASTNGTVNTFDARRRTSKTNAGTLLASLANNTRNASRISIVGKNGSRVSLGKQFGLS